MTASAFTIVRATPADRPRAWAIVDAYCEEIGVVVRDSPELFDTYFKDGSGIWLAEADDAARTVVGCIVLRPIVVTGVNRPAEVKRLYVLPSARGHRLSERLLAALEKDAADSGYDALYLDSKDDLLAAIKFYYRQGYADCERYNDNPQATIFMRKAVAVPNGAVPAAAGQRDE
jgi:GNAT superfamily N-acetyltransferase